MAFKRLRKLGFERRAPAGGAEGAIAGGATGAAGDLRQLGRIKSAKLVAVEFAVGGEGDVIDIEVEPPADGVGGDEIFDVARLIERDLRVARASISPASAFCAAPASAFASEPAAEAAAVNMNPSRRPIA